MSLQDGSVKFTGKGRKGKIVLAFLGIVELVLTAVFVITLASNILFPEQSSAAANAVSKVISYEGRLTDASGNPLGGSGTNYCFRFSIYDNQTVGAGTKLWPAGTPTTNTVTVVNGVFNVGIGVADDLGSYNFYDNDTIYLNIEATSSLAASCAGETSFVTLAPRQRFDAVAFARATRDVYGSLLKTVNASNLVQVGSGSGAGTPILLGLDWKNVADATLSYVGQSCTTNGTMWYNSSVSRALICEGGLVQELGTTATTTIAAIGTNATAPVSAGTVVFSNSNGVTFGLNGSTVTASVAAGGGGGPTLQGSGTYTQSTGTVQFANSNGLTFGLSNNGVMTGSHNGLTTAMASNAGSNFVQATAAFNGTNASGTIASNGISISVAAPGGGGGGATFSNYQWPPGQASSFNAAISQGGVYFGYIPLEQNLTATRAMMLASGSIASNSSGAVSVTIGVYTRNGSTLSLASSASQSYSYTSNASSAVSGLRRISVPMNINATPGDYWYAVRMSTANAGTFTMYGAANSSVAFSGNLGVASATNRQLIVGVGTTTSAAMPASIALTAIQASGAGASRQPWILFSNFDLN